MRIFLILILFLAHYYTSGQSKYLPKNPKVGKCYKQNFQFDKKFEWMEVDCDSIKQKHIICEESEECNTNKQKMKGYQEKLQALGYKVKVTGILNDETIDAHHKYLKFKEKQARRKKRELRKQKRMNNN